METIARIVAKGRRRRACALAVLAAAAMAAAGLEAAGSEKSGECVTDDDCATVLCPCNWIPISKANEPAIADCRTLQQISRCGSITPDGRPAVECRAGMCRDANAPAPAASSASSTAARRAPRSEVPLAPSDDARERPLVDSGALYDGMTRDLAVRFLGEPATESAERIEWRYHGRSSGPGAAILTAAKRGSRLYDWHLDGQ